MSSPSVNSPHIAATPSAPDSDRRWLPYQWMFPLGVLWGLIGVGLWVSFGLGWTKTYPGLIHIDLQVHGFLFAFIVGFLMTALPRFSRTSSATRLEMLYFLSLSVLTNLLALFGFLAQGRCLFLLSLVSLFVFAARRFIQRQANPPDEFVFVLAALLLGLVGATFRALGSSMSEYAGWELIGRRLITEGMVTCLVIGIAGKLAPLFFGHAMGVFAPTRGAPLGLSRRQIILGASAVAYASTFVLEYGVSVSVAVWLRAALLTAIILGLCQVHRKPKTGGFIVWFLWISLWMLPISFWGTAFHVNYRVPVLHVLFMGGFSVMILAIATRVITAHGNYAPEIEKTSQALLMGAVFILAGTVLRGISDLFPQHYFALLGWAGGLWVLGLAVWGLPFSKMALAHPGTVSDPKERLRAQRHP